MKAILVLNEMPKSCESCPCMYDTMCCQATDKALSWEDMFKRPDWCPLKELPKKLYRHDLDIKYPKETEAMIDNYQNGFNDCLEEIMEVVK